jgi:hypothetical protein
MSASVNEAARAGSSLEGKLPFSWLEVQRAARVLASMYDTCGHVHVDMDRLRSLAEAEA